MARTVPPSFVENGPKLRVFILVIGECRKVAKNRGVPRKMNHCSVTEFFLGWFQWESCSPGYTGDMPCWQKSWLPKWLFAPNIQIIQVSKSPINVFNMKKVSYRTPDMRVPNVLLPPQKMDFWPKNGQIWPKTGIFGQIWAFLAHLIHCLTTKQCGQVA